jgi:predicted peptidase
MIARTDVYKGKIEHAVELKYLIYLPHEYDSRSTTLWPLIVYLHGKGDRGDDPNILKMQGLPYYLEQKKDLPFVAIAPQCPLDSEWIFQLEVVYELIRSMHAQYKIDKNRCSLTGNSMGGIGAWHMGINYPHLFAAIVPICGGTYPFLGYPEAVDRLKETPIWVFHGDDDDVIPVQLSRVLVDRLIKINGNVRFTVYKNTGHDCWTKTYSNPELYLWLAEQKRGMEEER